MHIAKDDAGTMVGVSAKAISEWRRKGCEDVESRFGLFYERTEEARVAWKTRMIKKVTDSLDWKAAWKLLCSRFPHEFRNFMNVSAELPAPDGGAIPFSGGFNVVLELADPEPANEKRFEVD